VAVHVDPGQFISATATDPSNDTSQFAQCVEVSASSTPDAPVSLAPATIAAAAFGLGGLAEFGLGTSLVDTLVPHGDRCKLTSQYILAEDSELRNDPVQSEWSVAGLHDLSPGRGQYFASIVNVLESDVLRPEIEA
jgi:hypothetical protein